VGENRVDVLCLQETHVNEMSQINMIEKDFKEYYLIYSMCEKNEEVIGVAILTLMLR
jgi:exonuclease III